VRSGTSPDPGAVVARRSLIAALGAVVLLARWHGEREWTGPAMLAALDRALAAGNGSTAAMRAPQARRAGP
jgi:hypothetical protein